MRCARRRGATAGVEFWFCDGRGVSLCDLVFRRVWVSKTQMRPREWGNVGATHQERRRGLAVHGLEQLRRKRPPLARRQLDVLGARFELRGEQCIADKAGFVKHIRRDEDRSPVRTARLIASLGRGSSFCASTVTDAYQVLPSSRVITARSTRPPSTRMSSVIRSAVNGRGVAASRSRTARALPSPAPIQIGRTCSPLFSTQHDDALLQDELRRIVGIDTHDRVFDCHLDHRNLLSRG
jgi:hypothetical protein